MKKYLVLAILAAFLFSGCGPSGNAGKSNYMKENASARFSARASGSGALETKTVYLAGGCFWGTEKYLDLIPGVEATVVGYANGRTLNPTYEDVSYRNSGHAETVKVEYNPGLVSLSFLLDLFYEVIDPVSVNRQGNDIGPQYRSGVYFEDGEDEAVILASIAELQKGHARQIGVEVKPLDHFFPAEEYHQKYLQKNPYGYCHISQKHFAQAKQAIDTQTRSRYGDKKALLSTLTALQLEVTQRGATEPPFRNEYFATFEPGIYVDITTGEPLFVSTDKFKSQSGWPSFSRPISDGLIAEIQDFSHGMSRVEVRSILGDSHLGHVFTDGPRESGGLRYCINSASLRFVHMDEKEALGYGSFLPLLAENM